MLPNELEKLTTESKTKLKQDLRIIFNNVKSRFIYKKDTELWDQLDHWETYEQIPNEGSIIGDCDCFAMACRKQCKSKGIPSRLVFCRVNVGGSWQGHLVLECIGYIFDCNSFDIMTISDLPYRWVSISGYEKGDSWYSLIS